MDRIEQNCSDYIDTIMVKSKAALVDSAGQIANVQDVYQYVTEQHEFTVAELDYLLQFKDPLQVIADRWSERDAHIDDIGDAIADITESQDVSAFHSRADAVDSDAPTRKPRQGDAR